MTIIIKMTNFITKLTIIIQMITFSINLKISDHAIFFLKRYNIFILKYIFFLIFKY
jgi:hypothetical protein